MKGAFFSLRNLVFILIALLNFSATMARAQNATPPSSAGGDFVFCFNQPISLKASNTFQPLEKNKTPLKVTLVQLLDYYEGLQVIGVPLKVSNDGNHLGDTVKQLLDRVADIDDSNGEYLAWPYKYWLIETEILPRDQIEELKEFTPHAIGAPNCYLEKMVYQNFNAEKGGRRYRIDRALYDLVEQNNAYDSFAGLIVQEMMLNVLDVDHGQGYNDSPHPRLQNTDLLRPTNYAFAANLGASVFDEQVLKHSMHSTDLLFNSISWEKLKQVLHR